jgi:CheY-like chemotaxis protein
VDSQTASQLDAATILVCDDDPSLRELVRAVLGTGYRFVEAADGAEALEITRELRPDLIVLDVMLPGLSGIEVLEAIRMDDELRDVKVVVITAWSHAELEAQVAGADRFVSKPFDPDDLSRAVEELLAGVGSTEPANAEGPALPGPEREIL